MNDLEKRMQTDGFPELRWLWSWTRRRSCDPTRLERARQRHMGFPRVNWWVSAPVGLAVYLNSYLPGPSRPLDLPMRLLLGALGVYAFWFGITVLWRTLFCDWKRVCADDLAFMLECPSYRGWLESTPSYARVRAQVGEAWDDPEYRVQYACDEGEVRQVAGQTDPERLRQALCDVLGTKQGGTFQPGRYFDNLRDRKKSVARFVKAHESALARSREGTIASDEAGALLQALRAEMLPGSAGERYLQDVLARVGTLPRGVVEVSIWQRDPWVDLTSPRDFFSSASLRGGSPAESLERRTKGLLGPFGYLRNPSISALDFRTAQGRCVRARLGAARVGSARVLFVDAVEGRFDIKPRLIQRALEDYARAAGFDWLLCHGYPLNQVPRRFVKSLARSGAEPVWVDLAYLEAGNREYLDAFGLPLEPFEYAFPRGRVFAYAVALNPGVALERTGPSPLLPLARRALLPLVLASTLLVLGWTLLRTAPATLLPTTFLVAATLAWERRKR